MVLKLYGIPISTCTQRVRVVLEELNVPYELVSVDLATGANKSKEFLAHQPFGQIPYIVDDDGFEVFESRAIARYIALKYGGAGKLIPASTDVQKAARFEQAASIETSNFDPSAAALAFENVFKPAFTGQPADKEIVEKQKATLESKLNGYEVLLSKSKYLAGDDITVVDFFHLPYGSLLKRQGIDFLESSRWPNIARWWNDVSSRPTWAKVNVQI